MHGRPREAKHGEKDPEKRAIAEQKAKAFGELCNQVITRRRAKQYDAKSLAMCAALLELNPEMYSGWNYRREAVQDILAAGGDAAVEAAQAELALTERALRKNPKSYSAWHHRRWVVGHGLCSLDHELTLVAKLLSLDDRNFHGWNYRRFITSLQHTPPEEELLYTKSKINSNFSNYSAWHTRTSLLPKAHATQPMKTLSELLAEEKQATTSTAAKPVLLPSWVVDEEFELVKQALWTEPEDQSGWLYHTWLLGAALAARQAAQGTSQQATAQETLVTTLQREATMCQELLDMEPDAKWPMLTKARILRALGQWIGDDDGASHEAAAQELYEVLQQVDPARKGYYVDEVEGRCCVLLRAAPLRGG